MPEKSSPIYDRRGPKIIDLSGLQDTWQVQALARSELSLIPADAIQWY